MTWLYLLLAVRAFLPLHLDATQAFLLVVILVAMLGWARLAEIRDHGMSIAVGFRMVITPMAPALRNTFQRSPAD